MKALRAMREAYWQHLGEWGGVVVGSLVVVAWCATAGHLLDQLA